MASRLRAPLLVVCCALLATACSTSTGCTTGAGSLSGWATRLEPPPKGLALKPPPPDDVYWVSFQAAKLPARTTGGQLWDELGGWPDPVAILYVDDREVLRTAAASDTIEPTWGSPSGNLQIPDSASLRVEVEDQDAIKNLPIGKGRAGAPTTTDLSEGKMIFDLGSQSELILRVEPAHGLLGLGFDYEIVAGALYVKKVLSHSPASRAGLTVGDQIVGIGDRMLEGYKSREIRSTINTIGSKPKKVIVKHRSGTTETFELSVGPIYPLYDEYGELD